MFITYRWKKEVDCETGGWSFFLMHMTFRFYHLKKNEIDTFTFYCNKCYHMADEKKAVTGEFFTQT